MEKTGAVLVAAGLSSRMHSFKPLLPFGRVTIAEHVVQTMKQLGADPIVVVTGYRGEELERQLFYFGVRFVKNQQYRETQMFDSIRLGVQAVSQQCGRILIMPMDMPGIRLETFQKVLAAEGPVVKTCYQGRSGHPIVIQSDAARKLCAYQGEGGLRGAVQASGLQEILVPVEDRGVCWDVDTPEEYESLVQWYFGQGSRG